MVIDDNLRLARRAGQFGRCPLCMQAPCVCAELGTPEPARCGAKKCVRVGGPPAKCRDNYCCPLCPHDTPEEDPAGAPRGGL